MDSERKLLRATWIDYNDGLYFITICTHNHIQYFGKIKHGYIKYNKLGMYAQRRLLISNKINNGITILESIIMPNHIHAIVKIETNDTDIIVTNEERLELNRVPLLSRYIASYKSSVTWFANQQNIKFKWQRSYYDHMIRHTGEYRKISEYINTNVERWINDKYYNE